MVKLQDGNHKLSRRIKNWSLPPIKTCPGADECTEYCYALKSWKQYHTVRMSWTRNLKQSKQEDFVDKMVDYIKKKKELDAVRIHVAGDFYCQNYLDKWIKIANRLEDTIFYAYTKSDTLDFTDRPDNFKVILSANRDQIKKAKEKGLDGIARVADKGGKVLKEEKLCPYHEGKGCGSGSEECSYCYKDTEFKQIVFLKH